MILNNDQEKAIKIILDRYRAGERYSVLAGPAGSGKTTCVKFIVQALLGINGIREEDICYTSFTGKAVQVLINHGNKNAITLHKLLYQARPMPNGRFMFIKKPYGSLEYKIIIVDETSMVSRELVDILLNHNAYIIFCGDNHQLPPVDKNQDNHLLDHPHAYLSTIQRQAADSGIIQLSMKIRNGERIDGFATEDAIVLPKSQFVDGMLGWSDIILSATNATRISLNNQMRQMKGYSAPIEHGEKLICCRNYWDCISDDGNALTNGCIGYLSNSFDSFQMFPDYLGGRVATFQGEFKSEYGDDFGSLVLDRQCVITGTPALDGKMKYKIGRVKKWKDSIPLEFTYGYCITGHRSQGSQWEKVLVVEENFPFDREEHKKWLYTCCTRAESKVVIVR